MRDCTGVFCKGKMRREDKAAPEGSRVGAQTKDGLKNQAAPNWSDLASRDQTWQILGALADIANNRGKNVAQVSLRSGGKFLQYFSVKCGYCRWLLEKKNVPSVVIGVKSLAQLEDNLGSLGWSLTPGEMERLDEVSSIPEPYPYEMINRLNKTRIEN